MSRSLRIEFSGAWYHVMDRGVEKRDIFVDDRDRSHFLDLLSLSRERLGTVVHAYCLMDNHYHLLLETPNANLSQAVHLINAGYTTWFNKRHDRVGTLFQGRFKALLVERDAYALSASRYVHRNPVCAGLCQEPFSYIWSSSRSYAGLQRVPAFLETEAILGLAGGAAQYREYLGSAEDDKRELEKDAVAGTILGSPLFADRVVALRGTSIFAKQERDVPAVRALRQMPLADAIVDAANTAVPDAKLRRKVMCYLLYKHAGLSLRTIAMTVGHMSESGVSLAGSRLAAQLEIDSRLQAQIESIERSLCLL